IQNLARVGKARAQLNLAVSTADFTAAATTAAQVPAAGFVYLLSASITAVTNGVRLENGFNQANVVRRGISVSNLEGGSGVSFRPTPADPRVPTTQDPLNGFDGQPLFRLNNYAITGTALGRTTPFPLASSVEARLIQAEAQLRAGNFAAPGTGTLAILNSLRASFSPPLLPLADPVTQTAREDLLFRERAFWLYATGHRLGDMRRLVRPLGQGGYARPVASVFPSGAYPQGGTYGTDVNLPIPFDEQNNPNFEQCLNRDP
ncbi:MAG: hypothetical protein ACREON_10520, partial [Gemmatimonadaceae bacterium]